MSFSNPTCHLPSTANFQAGKLADVSEIYYSILSQNSSLDPYNTVMLQHASIANFFLADLKAFFFNFKLLEKNLNNRIRELSKIVFALRGGQVVKKTCSLLHKKCKLGMYNCTGSKNANLICESSLLSTFVIKKNIFQHQK